MTDAAREGDYPGPNGAVKRAQGILSGRIEAGDDARIVARAYLDLHVVEAELLCRLERERASARREAIEEAKGENEANRPVL